MNVKRTMLGMSGIVLVIGTLVVPAGLAGAASLPAPAASRAPAAPPAPPSDAPDEKNPHLWQPRTTSVAVFKNGLGFFMREGEVALRDGWAVAEQVPPAAFGALAIYSHQAGEVVDVVGSGPGEVVEFDGRDAPKDAPAKRARFEASKGLKVSMTYTHKGADHTAAGKLVSVGPDFVVLENESNSFAVPLEGITRMQVLELPLRVHVAGDGAKPIARTRLGMAYLRKGVTWIPEYTFKAIDADSGELSLRGTLVNEAEDLIHADVHFVVGVPHFLHTEYLAPLAVGQVIRTIGMAVAPPQLQSQMTNNAIAFTNGAGGNAFNMPGGVVERAAAEPAGDLGAAMGNLPLLEGPAATDFTVYTRKDMTFRRGEKAIVTLLTRKIRYAHIYRWSPPQAMEHFLVLHNDTDSAWTTGPVLAISGDQPLSEDLLKYTPIKGNAEVPVTTSINISHEKTETEIDRKLKAYTINDHTFMDQVTLQGTLSLRNFENRPVDVVIANSVPGKPVEASDAGVISVDADRLVLRERSGAIRWTVQQLPPGQVKKLNYKYERYVPSN